MAVWTLLALFSAPWTARAVTLRYLLVVGNNRGVDAHGKQPFPPLKHAESEAQRVHDKLVELSGFPASSDHTILLLGAKQRDLLWAAQSIARQRVRDQRVLRGADTLFVFYFTGHGLRGQLLLEDGPLPADELTAMFNLVDADLSIGVFDACYSGSLSNQALASKGILPAPGLGLSRVLPEEVLATEGRMSFVSSGPDQPSYEDEELGGVFTHFFIEGLAKAERQGPGIRLQQIWDYARNNTIEYTSARNRRQVPEMFVSQLKAIGPLFFSFPMYREATLALSASLHGRFLLSYADGSLVEFVDKERGQHKELAVYPGEALLTLLDGSEVLLQEEVDLQPGMRLHLASPADGSPRPRLGTSARTLWKKRATDQSLTATAISKDSTLLLGATYAFNVAPRRTLAPQHLVALDLRLDRGGIIVGINAGFEYGRQAYQARRFRLMAASAEIRTGYGWDLDPVRVSASALVGMARLWQTHDDGQKSRSWLSKPGAMLGILLHPVAGLLATELFVRGGPMLSKGAGAGAKTRWTGWLGGGLRIYYGLR